MSRVWGVLVVLVGVVAVAEARPAKDAVVPVEAEPAPVAEAEAEPAYELPKHIEGPAKVDLGDGVEIDLPAGMILFERAEARAILEAGGDNPDDTLAIVWPAGGDWQVSIDLADVGYVSDRDAGKLDADNLLDELSRSTIAQNEVRRTKGVSALYVDGWNTPPLYVGARRELHWSLKLHSSDGPILNEVSNLLGRRGYVLLNLIASPDAIAQARLESAGVLSGVHFQAGHRYQDFDPRTDRDSGMSLRNLVVGASVVAAGGKLGVFAAIALILKKIGIVIAAAVGGVWKWLTGRRKRADA